MFKKILIITFTAIIFAGCQTPQQPQENLAIKGLKVRDLKPYQSDPNAEEKLFAARFEVIIFDIPVENLKVLKDVTTLLSTDQLQFDNAKTFKNNAFSAGFGQSTMWDKVAKILGYAKATQSDNVSLLLTNNQNQTVPVQILNDRRTIYYASADNPAQQMDIGPGQMLININAENRPDQKGICQVKITPMFSMGISSPVPQIAEKLKTKDIFFTAAGFDIQMSPDDFIFIWPAKGVSQKTSLANAFFVPEDKQVFKTYLIICTGLN